MLAGIECAPEHHAVPRVREEVQAQDTVYDGQAVDEHVRRRPEAAASAPARPQILPHGQSRVLFTPKFGLKCNDYAEVDGKRRAHWQTHTPPAESGIKLDASCNRTGRPTVHTALERQ